MKNRVDVDVDVYEMYMGMAIYHFLSRSIIADEFLLHSLVGHELQRAVGYAKQPFWKI